MTTMSILGIDIGKQSFDLALKSGEKYQSQVFNNNVTGFEELSRWLKTHNVAHGWFCLEATGIYGQQLVNYLISQGHQVSVVNPRAIEAYARSQMLRNKTDKQDARLIAQYCESSRPQLWQPLAPELVQLQALARHLESLTTQHAQQLNHLESQTHPLVITSTHRLIASIEQEIQQTQALIRAEIAQNAQLQKNNELLMSITGIGQTTATLILAELGEISRFESVKQLDAYVGLCPSEHRSGTSVKKKTQLSKLGNSRLRKGLYFPALSAKQHNPIVRDFCLRLKQKGKATMAIIGAAMRKLLHLVYGVLKTQQPFNPHYLEKAI